MTAAIFSADDLAVFCGFVAAPCHHSMGVAFLI